MRPGPRAGYAPPQGNAYADPSNPSRPPGLCGRPAARRTSARRRRPRRLSACACATAAISRSSATPTPIRRSSATPSARRRRRRCSTAARSTTRSASNGARYADLDNAFVYRQKIVEGCTCNGKDSFGLARIDVACRPDLAAGRHRGERRQREGGADRDGGQQGTPRSAPSGRHCAARVAPRRHLRGRRDTSFAACGAGARGRRSDAGRLISASLLNLPDHLLGDRERRGEAGRTRSRTDAPGAAGRDRPGRRSGSPRPARPCR